MTEKRADYRKRQAKNKRKEVFKRVKQAFDNQDSEPVDVNPDFKRQQEKRPLQGDGENYNPSSIQSDQPKLDKGLRLKKRLNTAILVMIVLIIIVLLALFHL